MASGMAAVGFLGVALACRALGRHTVHKKCGLVPGGNSLDAENLWVLDGD